MRMTRSLCGKGKFTQPLCFFFLFTISGFSPAEADAVSIFNFYIISFGLIKNSLINYSII